MLAKRFAKIEDGSFGKTIFKMSHAAKTNTRDEPLISLYCYQTFKKCGLQRDSKPLAPVSQTQSPGLEI